MDDLTRAAVNVARIAGVAIVVIVTLVAASRFGPFRAFLSEEFGIGPYETTSERPVSFTVVARDGAVYAFAVPRVFLAARVGEGDALASAIGVRAVTLSLDETGAAPCRLDPRCEAISDIEVSFPYPYEIGDGAPPAIAHVIRESDVAGFALTVTGGAARGDAETAFKTETRRYRAQGEDRVPRMDCDMAVAGAIEGGVCRAAVLWRDGAYLEIAMAARRRGDVHALADAAVALFDGFSAPVDPGAPEVTEPDSEFTRS